MGRRQIDNHSQDMVRYWRYLIRLENLGPEALQLRERFWKVFSVSGSLESVKGKGVVGSQPILAPSQPIFQYHSHVQVQVPWAHMWGSFRFDNLKTANSLDVKIPAFPLCDRLFWNRNQGGDPPIQQSAP
ncbi:polymerase delta-interacting protein 2 [Cichlidogyrus casuarinus]|uniref:Polymerase delta-interacting protein 2 n=1 Tax=Cichlidogyrus casuarinus TaxID=1844966 RepID=A0ABD2Q1B0_9PLAT